MLYLFTWGTVFFHKVFSWKSSCLPNNPIREFNKHAKFLCTHRIKPFQGSLETDSLCVD
ncbi:hypothetical protein Mapa_003722 [Marchantia paleacea]|nr:hypothetical protein Mapa_003722 [Marchantia paleacea]